MIKIEQSLDPEGGATYLVTNRFGQEVVATLGEAITIFAYNAQIEEDKSVRPA